VFDVTGTKVYDGVHRTNGIDMYVTGERTILLDSQVFVNVTYFCDIDIAFGHLVYGRIRNGSDK